MIHVDYTKVLLEKLHTRFKNELPTEEPTLYSVGVTVGHQEVIKYIESVIEFQEQGGNL